MFNLMTEVPIAKCFSTTKWICEWSEQKPRDSTTAEVLHDLEREQISQMLSNAACRKYCIVLVVVVPPNRTQYRTTDSDDFDSVP